MPIDANPDGPNGPEIIIHLGYDDIGIGRIVSDDPNIKGVGFKQLPREHKDGGFVPAQEQGEGLTVFLTFTQERAVILIEDALRIIRQEMGMTVLARTYDQIITDGLHVKIGNLKNEIEELKAEIEYLKLRPGGDLK